jgi:GT2 family glycosyltransferase
VSGATAGAAAMTSPLIPVSVIVPVHGANAGFERCLAALRGALPAGGEVVVVADGDGAAAAVAASAGARVVTLTAPGGPARARNAGARAARGEIFVFVDADVVVRPDTITRLCRTLREAGVAAVFGSYDDTPAARNFISRYRNLLHHHVHQTGRAQASTFWAGCGAIRRDVFLELGGFNERYRRPSIEDIELGYRLRGAGHSIRLEPTIQVTHLKRWTAGAMLVADIRDRALPWTALIVQRGGLIDDLNLRRSSRLSAALVVALVVTLLAMPGWPPALVVAAAEAALLIVLDAPLYQLFRRRYGTTFAVAAMPWHWLYYLYSVLAFVLGGAWYRLRPPAFGTPATIELDLS